MSDQAIRAARPSFSLFRYRPIAPRRNQGWRRNRTSARVSWPSSVICLAEMATRGEKRKHAQNSRTKCRLGAVDPVMCPVAVFILERRKPMPAEKSSDVAVSAVSPLSFPRRRRPIGRPGVTLTKKLSEALRRLRRRCVAPRRTSPSRRDKPTPAHQVREVASTAASPLLFPRRS